jgi:hypothetical protein
MLQVHVRIEKYSSFLNRNFKHLMMTILIEHVVKNLQKVKSYAVCE